MGGSKSRTRNPVGPVFVPQWLSYRRRLAGAFEVALWSLSSEPQESNSKTPARRRRYKIQTHKTRTYSVRSIVLPTRDAPYTLFCDGGGATNLTTCSSRSGLNGFAMHTTAPS
jgi:hypothetical protein